MWNLEKRYRWSSLQGRNRDTDVENGCVDTEGGMNWEIRIDICKLPCVKQIASGNLLYSTGTQLGALCDRGGGMEEWRDLRGRGYMCTYSWLILLCSRNWYSIVKQLYLNLKRKKIFPNSLYICMLLLFSHSVVSKSLQPMDYSPPGSSVHGISQARILGWVAISFSRESSQPRDICINSP